MEIATKLNNIGKDKMYKNVTEIYKEKIIKCSKSTLETLLCRSDFAIFYDEKTNKYKCDKYFKATLKLINKERLERIKLKRLNQADKEMRLHDIMVRFERIYHKHPARAINFIESIEDMDTEKLEVNK